MLILTRKIRETLNIGNDVTVTIEGVKAGPGPHRHQCAEGRGRAPQRDLRADAA